jgi:hypothetical protein
MAENLPVGRDPASVRRRLEAMEKLLERAFIVPGINRPVGMDAIVGLVPVVGDLITASMGAWLLWEARNLGMPKLQLTRMAAHIGMDSLLGAIPLAGDLFDFAYRSNTKNVRIIKRYLDKNYPSTMTLEGEVVARR